MNHEHTNDIIQPAVSTIQQSTTQQSKTTKKLNN